MDEIWVACPQCQVNAAYPVQLAGQPVACRQCAKAFQLPETSQISQQEEALPDAIEDDAPYTEPLRYEDLPVTVNRRGFKANNRLARGTVYSSSHWIVVNDRGLSRENILSAILGEFWELRQYSATFSRPIYLRHIMGEMPLLMELALDQEAVAIAYFSLELNLGRPVLTVSQHWQLIFPWWERLWFIGPVIGELIDLFRLRDQHGYSYKMYDRLTDKTKGDLGLFYTRIADGLRSVISRLGLRDDQVDWTRG
jgi:hypothetical protein